MEELLKSEIREGMSEGELRGLRETRDRLATEVERLTGELAQAQERTAQTRREAQQRAVQQASELGAVRDRASETQERVGRLEAELDALRRDQSERTQKRLEDELRQLKSDVRDMRATQQSTVEELGRLQHSQATALAGLARPGPVEGPPAMVPERLVRDYMVAARSGLMDAKWYRSHYADVAETGADPILHYLEHGWREGRQPGPAFDGSAYLAANPDLAAAGANPLVHFQTDGAFEMRPLVPSQSPAPSDGKETRAGRREAETLSEGPSHFWFFAGDLLEWLSDHEHLTGVGRVTSELLFAALLADRAEIRLCVLDLTRAGLRQLHDRAPLQDLVRRTAQSFSAGEEIELEASLARPDLTPAPGDHVFFTGVVWTDQYIRLFENLAASGISFSLLVHDIIPLLSPPIDDGGHARVFARWLETALKTASTIYVSNQAVAEDLARWTVAARIRPRASIAVIKFGARLGVGSAVGGRAVLDQVEAEFVLCVGTIDARKNQRFLLRIWQELAIRLGADILPQLVLVGRDDLSLPTEPAFQALEQLGKVKLLTGLADAEVSTLYRACRFTAFPSMSEGYGLPVAESLGNGKLCIASNLPAIRAHAGDLAWYFNPGSMADALAMFERAITSPGEVQAASERILQDHEGCKWRDTFAQMRHEAVQVVQRPPAAPRLREPDAYAGSAKASERVMLERAAKWCVERDVEVSILIVNWNAAALTMDCIRQVWAATEGVHYEIVIADNGSAEAELAPLRHLGPGVRLIEIGCNRFFGEANNIAAEAARGRYICFLNNDAFVEEGWLQTLRQKFRDDPLTGAAGPLFRFPGGPVQEGGGFVDAGGYPVRGGRGEAAPSDDILKPRKVDYISAAALLVDHRLFLDVGGFDLAFEPAYYEDTDLCFKLTASGRHVVYEPTAVVVHIEGASANGDSAAEMRRKHLGDLNRGKFVARWGGYLRDRDAESLAVIRRKLGLDGRHRRAGGKPANAPTAIVYTPEPLTPGGGERYLLTLAELLLQSYDVTLVTPHPYSRTRILDLAVGFGLDLSRIHLSLESEAAWDNAELQVVMGNHIIPRVPARARVNLFHCQFPFPMEEQPTSEDRERLKGYNEIIVNSHYTALHVEAAINGFQLADVPIRVVPPPSRQLARGNRDPDRVRILSVGRFFRGGHSKRQDTLIQVFRSLEERAPGSIELHLAGSSHPAPENMTYLSDLMAEAKGTSIYFHVNAAPDDLDALYASADIYWHATGLGANLVAEPWAAEHFGISIVEAMSAGAIPFALASGGAREIVTSGIDGFLYRTQNDLLEQTSALLTATDAERAQISVAAINRARAFSSDAFARTIRTCLAAHQLSG